MSSFFSFIYLFFWFFFPHSRGPRTVEDLADGAKTLRESQDEGGPRTITASRIPPGAGHRKRQRSATRPEIYYHDSRYKCHADERTGFLIRGDTRPGGNRGQIPEGALGFFFHFFYFFIYRFPVHVK